MGYIRKPVPNKKSSDCSHYPERPVYALRRLWEATLKTILTWVYALPRRLERKIMLGNGLYLWSP